MKLIPKTFLMILVLSLCGYGYIGKLPELGVISKRIDPKNPQKVDPVEPLAPKNYTEFKKPIRSKGNYSQYIAKTKDYLFSLKNVRDFLEKEDKPDVQLLSAKANTSSLHLNNLLQRYRGKPEESYKSFKQILKIDSDMQSLLTFVKASNANKDMIKKKKTALVKSIDELIEDFKDSGI